jgi:16S rRNA (adenine1518-N6/adenine1519-N6)-dimethyltransferase
MKAKKSLGQNFLKSVPALNKIIEAGEISKEDIILEIGPGKGALTTKLLEHAGIVVAVEKDRELFIYLQEKFVEKIKNKKLILLNDDILDFNVQQNVLERTLGRRDGDGQRNFSAGKFRGESENVLRNYKIIANIPYNITGAILKKFLTEKYQPILMVLMVQNEVAKRIVARDDKQSILSISVKAYGTPKLIMKVPARYFSPAPKVDSAIISIKDISRKNFIKVPIVQSRTLNSLEFEEKFWEMIHLGFAHKRKKLSSNFKKKMTDAYPGGNASGVFGVIKKVGDKRAEDLSLEDWLELTRKASV